MINVFDIVILVVIALSTIIGLLRGLVREALSLASWLLAFWIAFTFAGEAGMLFARYISAPPLQVAAGFATLFLVTLLAASVVSWLIHRVFTAAKIRGPDRALGAVFGVVRGLVLVVAFMLVAGATPLPEQQWWQRSVLARQLAPFTVVLARLLPADVAAQLQPR